MKNCLHPVVTKCWKGAIDKYNNQTDFYWSEVKCLKCLKVWLENDGFLPTDKEMLMRKEDVLSEEEKNAISCVIAIAHKQQEKERQEQYVYAYVYDDAFVVDLKEEEEVDVSGLGVVDFYICE